MKTLGEIADKTNMQRVKSTPSDGRLDGKGSVTMLQTAGKRRLDFE